MDCTDIILGSARGQQSRVGDYYTRDRSSPRSDAFYGGGSNSLTAAIGKEENGVTTILFRRKLLGCYFVNIECLPKRNYTYGIYTRTHAHTSAKQTCTCSVYAKLWVIMYSLIVDSPVKTYIWRQIASFIPYLQRSGIIVFAFTRQNQRFSDTNM